MANKVENRTVNMYINGQPVYNDIKSMERAYRDLSKEVKGLDRNSKEYRQGVQQLKQLNGTLTQHRQQLRQVESSWGRVRKQALAFAGGLGIAGGLTALAMGLKSIISGAADVIMNFEQSNSRLNAVLGLTKEQTAALRDQQLQLGRSTAFTAAQAADAQTELAKLGFTLQEITALTPDVLNLAASAGTDLANAAAIAGATVRQFNLDASEGKRVVDVMAKSFSSSALDIEKFSVAMASAGPVAAQAGLSIERTTAMIGLLSDRGLDASTAGTSLRNMFLILSKEGITFEQAMDRVRNATDQNRAALELFGTRGATTAVILANNSEGLATLEGKLNDAAGAAQAMADEQLNNLRGDLTKLTSAWEGFILSIENGEGKLAQFFRTGIQLATEFLGAIDRFGKAEDMVRTATERSGVNTFFSNPMMFKRLEDFATELVKGRQELDALASSNNWDALTAKMRLIENEQGWLDLDTKEGRIELELLADQLEYIQALMRGDGSGDMGPFEPAKATGTAPGSTPKEVTPEELAAAAAKAAKDKADAQKAALEEIKAAYEAERLLIMEERARGLLEEEEFQEELLDLKLAYLLIEQEAVRDMGMETVAVEQQIADLRIAALKRLEDAQQQDNQADAKRHEEQLDRLDKEREARIAAAETAIMSAAMQGASAAEVGDASKLQARDVLNSARQVVKAYIAQAVAAQAAEILTKVPPPFSLVLAAAAGFAASALFDSLIPQFAGGTRYAPGGMALVGEQGPELMHVPEGASIRPAQDSRNLLHSQDAPVDFSSVPTLSGGSSSASGDMAAMMASFEKYANKVDSWSRQLQVINSQRAQDDWNDRYHDNQRMVRNIK